MFWNSAALVAAHSADALKYVELDMVVQGRMSGCEKGDTCRVVSMHEGPVLSQTALVLQKTPLVFLSPSRERGLAGKLPLHGEGT